MTALEYRKAIKKLGLSQRAAAKALRVNERTSRRWAKDGPPWYAEQILKEWIKSGLPPATQKYGQTK